MLQNKENASEGARENFKVAGTPATYRFTPEQLKAYMKLVYAMRPFDDCRPCDVRCGY